MKRLLTVLLAGLLIVAITAPALAWEFEMKGEYEYRMRYLSRVGANDIFGSANLQDAGAMALPGGIANFVGFAGPTIYNRGAVPADTSDASNVSNGGQANGTPGLLSAMRITRGGYSRWGSDAFYSDSRLTLVPVIRVNPAIRVHGTYTVGGYRNKYFQAAGNGTTLPFDSAGTPPFERYYMSQVSSNAYDTAAVGSWEQFRATVQLPIGILSVGVKDFPFGIGATLANNTRAEAFLTVVPYGPFRFLHGLWLSRGRFAESWATTPDSDQKNSFFQGMLFTYDNADLSVGAGTIYRTFHGNKANFGATIPGLAPTGAAITVGGVDDRTWINLAYAKYNNGRFFFNTEYAWVNVDRYFLGAGPLAGNSDPSLVVPLNIEGYHFFTELGAMAGPAKITLAYALASGRDLDHARTLTGAEAGPGQPMADNPGKQYFPFAINYQAMEPYEWLMFNTYAGGINGGWNTTDVTFVADEHGMMTDAYAFAGRLDYAVASNLNFWGSYIWAHRLERAGVFKGQYTNSGQVASAASRQAHVLANYGAPSGEVGGSINPYVDNGLIGWEANVGVDWKLLEGLTMTTRYAYWQPGDYFQQAFQKIGVIGGVPALNARGAVPDPIQALQGSLLINF